jgi:hypothetical protein
MPEKVQFRWWMWLLHFLCLNAILVLGAWGIESSPAGNVTIAVFTGLAILPFLQHLAQRGREAVVCVACVCHRHQHGCDHGGAPVLPSASLGRDLPARPRGGGGATSSDQEQGYPPPPVASYRPTSPAPC